MDAKKIGKIRMSVSRAQNSGSRVRYSPFVRNAIEQWLRGGENVAQVADKTGISFQTILRWSEQIAPDFQRVEIKSQNSLSQALVLRLENGVRISAPTADLMIEMLKALK
jgi:transposase-like protein